MLAARIGYEFNDPELLARSMAHRSWCAEHPGELSNERMEFLGDAVLGWVVAEELETLVADGAGVLGAPRTVRHGTSQQLGIGELVADPSGEHVERQAPSLVLAWT